MRAKKNDVEHKLKIARGQLDGILRMVEDNRYCIDISNQLLATQALLKSANQQILQAHIRTCVREAESQTGRSTRAFGKDVTVINRARAAGVYPAALLLTKTVSVWSESPSKWSVQEIRPYI